MSGRIALVDEAAETRALLERASLAPMALEPGPRIADRLRLARADLAVVDLRQEPARGLAALGAIVAGQVCGVVALTDPARPEDAVRALDADADEVLARPDEMEGLPGRLTTLLRARALEDGLRLHSETVSDLVGDEPMAPSHWRGGTVLTVGLDPSSGALPRGVGIARADGLAKARAVLAAGKIDLLLIARGGAPDPLRLAAELRAEPVGRSVSVLLALDAGAGTEADRAIAYGLADMATAGACPEETAARVRALLRAKRRRDRLRQGVRTATVLAMTDPLTGLANRRYGRCHLSRMVSASRRSGRPLGAVLLDLDRFKAVNDLGGHAAGDALLAAVAARIRGTLRPADLAVRLGGDEFLVALPDQGPESLRTVATRLRAAVARAGRDNGVTASIGTASLAPEDSADSLLQRADAALYRAKRAGGNRVHHAEVDADATAPAVPELAAKS